MRRLLFSRYPYIVLTGLAIATLLSHIFSPHAPNYKPWVDYLASLIITFITWEGNIRIDKWMDKNYPWMKNPAKRILIHGFSALVYSGGIIYFSMQLLKGYICPVPNPKQQLIIEIAIVIGLMVTAIVLSILVGINLFTGWKNSLKESEKYRTESLQAQLINLKNQVNPHFLFNNLSVLSSLVYINQDKAVEFINQLAKVYRYILDTKDRELVTLSTEITFLQSYCFLLKIRFEAGIEFTLDVPESCQNLTVPPMVLQILLENAIKHNETSHENPLPVKIVCEGDYISVSNRLQVRSFVEDSSKTGLRNIISRYAYFTDREVMMRKTENTFEVKLPLLPAE